MNEQVEFQATLDELAATAYRTAQLNGSPLQRGGMMFSPMILGAGYNSMVHASLRLKLAVSLALAAFGVATELFFYRRLLASRTHSAVLKLYGAGPVPCRFSVSDAGLRREIAGKAGDHPWEAIRSGVATDDGLEIVLRKPRELIVIPARAFRDSAQLSLWQSFVEMKLGERLKD